MREKPIAKLVKAIAGSKPKRKMHLNDLKKVAPRRAPDLIMSPVTHVPKGPYRPPKKKKPEPLATTMEYKMKNGMRKSPASPTQSMLGDVPATKKSQLGFAEDVSRSRDPILKRHINTAAKIGIGAAGFAAGSAWSEHKRKQRGY